MDVIRHFAHRFRLLALLRASLAAGAAVDLAAAVTLLLAPAVPGRALGVSLAGRAPAVLFLVLLSALLLAMLSALYAMAAHDPRRYSAIVLVAILGRLTGAVLFGALAVARPGLAGLWPLAVAEAAFGFLHAATWIPLRV